MVIDVNSELLHMDMYCRIIGIFANNNVQRKQKGEEGMKETTKIFALLFNVTILCDLLFMCFINIILLQLFILFTIFMYNS